MESKYNKVLLIGIDGMDPKLTDKLLSENKLPVCLLLSDCMQYRKITTRFTSPGQTPSWIQLSGRPLDFDLDASRFCSHESGGHGANGHGKHQPYFAGEQIMKGQLLVVEDDSDIAEMLRMYFDGQGYQVDVVSNGADALASTHQNIPNLIILDIILPDMDGYTICQELRSRPRTSHIPIIFLTQKDERSDRISGLELGADDYITKPFDIEELRLRVQNAIRRAERDTVVDPRTGLPTGQEIKAQLSQLLNADRWALLDCRITEFV